MAGDWIKMRKELADDPAVISIASATGLDDYGVVGRLHKLWSWADSQTVDGNASCVTGALAFAWINRYVLRENFAEAMITVGWLDVNESGIHFPNFMRHNGEPAKQRALAANRSNKQRNAKRNAMRNATTVTREEKRREEYKSSSKEEDSAVKSEFPESLDTTAFLDAWRLWTKHRAEKKSKLTPTATKRQLAKLAAMGEARAIAAIKHSVENGYTGVFEPNESSGRKHQAPGPGQRHPADLFDKPGEF
jgi:hypothetical protein